MIMIMSNSVNLQRSWTVYNSSTNPNPKRNPCNDQISPPSDSGAVPIGDVQTADASVHGPRSTGFFCDRELTWILFRDEICERKLMQILFCDECIFS